MTYNYIRFHSDITVLHVYCRYFIFPEDFPFVIEDRPLLIIKRKSFL